MSWAVTDNLAFKISVGKEEPLINLDLGGIIKKIVAGKKKRGGYMWGWGWGWSVYILI